MRGRTWKGGVWSSRALMSETEGRLRAKSLLEKEINDKAEPRKTEAGAIGGDGITSFA